MSVEKRYRDMYESGYAPWDIGRPDSNLTETVAKLPIASCKALDIGCGTGDNAIWLSRQRFRATGADTSDIAIGKAKEKAETAGVDCAFFQADILGEPIEGGPFEFVFDRGCFHSFDSDEERRLLAERVAANLAENGLWLSLVGNADAQRQGPGPPQRTVKNIVDAMEPLFEVLSLKSGHFDSNSPNPARAWICLTQKRG